MTCGLGKNQKKERRHTNYRIIYVLYWKPHTYEQLCEATKIHRNTLRLRLDQLVKDNIIIKHYYSFPNYGEKYYTRRGFYYLLNWAEKQSREMVGRIFGSNFVREEDSVSYEINSIHVVKPSRRKRKARIPPDNNELLSVNYNRLSWDEFLSKVMGLYIEEGDIFEQIRSFIDTAEPINSNSSGRVEPGLRRRDELELLIENRD